MVWPDSIGVVMLTQEDAAMRLRSSAALAERLGASLHLIDVSEPPARWRTGRGGDRALDDRKRVLEQFVSNVRTGDVEVSVTVRQGRRIVELVREVAEAAVDLVLLVVPGVSRSSAAVEAFVTRVVRKAPTSVLVLRPPGYLEGDVLAAVDVFAGDDDLAVAIIERAAALMPSSSSVTVLQVLAMSDGPAAAGAGPADFVELAAEEARGLLRGLVADRLEHLAPADVVVEVRAGSPVEEIAHRASAQAPSLLAVGTVSRGGISGLMLGNTAEALLRVVDCAVLVVKPAGFRSPLL